MTFSVVARDPKTGELGVATQSHWPFVGSLVPWGRAGVGVVATQASTEPAYGPRGTAILQQGVKPEAALAALLEQDDVPDVRQVAIMNSRGEFAHHTGARVINFYGAEEREGAVFIGNMLTNADVVPAMATAWDEGVDLSLSWRMLACLEAAQAAGGDVRGQQAAALIVLAAERTNAWEGVVADIRVDDHEQPLTRLGYLLNVREAYNEAHLGEVASTHGETEEAIAHYEKAQSLLPESSEIAFWRAVLLATAGRAEDSAKAFKIADRSEGNWRQLAYDLRISGRLTVNEATFNTMLGERLSLGEHEKG